MKVNSRYKKEVIRTERTMRLMEIHVKSLIGELTLVSDEYDNDDFRFAENSLPNTPPLPPVNCTGHR